ncbi:hypothetical protein M5D96_008830 [Drosophila gunungcola]|uniref:Uncharacterized protein n=1 Tax=Drosophila gunungcola TaxID=103775 RepID=A0A9Q0BNF5_9MUSC|nr:hypothetical protein M5D96_008830 [Drosophila gunungcola]
MSSPGAKVVVQRNGQRKEAVAVAEEQNLRVEETTLGQSDESRFTIISVQDVPGNCSRTISRLPTLLEEQELDPEQGTEERQHRAETEAQPEREQDREVERRLELLRNSWTLSPANSSRVWLLGTGSTS